ncbi:MAG TPA: hypothetical protein VFQ35_13320 [Polyangiaceae bacterium]|nr:hypothetical protein [Polyangiaceae bacterium]
MSRRLIPLLSALALPGCFFVSESDHHSSDGTVVVDWTIHGYKDSSLCTLGDADAIDVVIDRGDWSYETTQSCRAFSVSIDLAPGTYSGIAVLLDPSGADRTTEVDLGTFTIYGNDVLSVPIDFPAASFY